MARRGDPWFKFFPHDWLDDTRHLTLEQRGAYIDAIALQMATGSPLPVGIKKGSNRGDYRWLAHKLHISERKAEAVVTSLVDAMMLRHVAGGLSNRRCEEEIAARARQREANQANGAQGGRPAKLTEQRSTEGSAANPGSEPAQARASVESAPSQRRANVDPTLTQARPDPEKSKKPNENSAGDENSLSNGFDTRTGAHARSDPESDLEKKEGSPNGDSSAGADRSPSRADAVAAFEAYNDMAARCGLPTASRLSPDREQKLKVRLRHYGMEGWQRALANIERTPFLRGHNDRGWRASLDFMLQASSFAKLHDGGYDRSANAAQPEGPPQPIREHPRTAGVRRAIAALNLDEARP